MSIDYINKNGISNCIQMHLKIIFYKTINIYIQSTHSRLQIGKHMLHAILYNE